MIPGEFRTSLRELRVQSIDGAFQKFLESEINISQATRSAASASQIRLREILSTETNRDGTFPRILSDADDDFLGGSFGRHTKNRPLDDIDVYLPMDAHGLFYTIGGVVQPYTALTDGVLEEQPLFKDRNQWMDGPHVSSCKVIRGFAEVLCDHYPTTTRVRRAGEAVVVNLARGLGFDVVPCFSLMPSSPFAQKIYLIPNGEDGWLRTNPRIDNDMSERLHRDNAKTLRKAVKLVKWFNSEHLGGRLASYFAELAVMRVFQQHNERDQYITAVSAATAVAFQAVRDAALDGNQRSLIYGAPDVERGDITYGDGQQLNKGVEQSKLAWQYETLGRNADAITTWGHVFGDKFPSV